MTTRYFEIIPFARVLLGDILVEKYTDDVILAALRVTTAFLQLAGYDRGHTSDYNEITPNLAEKEKALWGKAAAVLIRNPEVLRQATDSVTIRTEEVSYDTSVSTQMLRELNAADLLELKSMIYAFSDGLVARRSDYGIQWPIDSPVFGRDPINN